MKPAWDDHELGTLNQLPVSLVNEGQLYHQIEKTHRDCGRTMSFNCK